MQRPIASPVRTRRVNLQCLAALTLGMVGCASAPTNRIATPSGLVKAPAPRRGERWRYQLINRYNDEPTGEVLAEVVAVLPEVRVQLTGIDGTDRGLEIYDRAWNVVQEPTYSLTFRFDQPVPLLPAQLAVGARDSVTTTYHLPGSSLQRRWQSNLTAVGWERIIVPAGRFDCLRVERVIYFDHHEMGWRAARRIDTLWYAPAVNRWVMREWTGFYRDESDLDRRGGLNFDNREDSVRWILLTHVPAPVAD